MLLSSGHSVARADEFQQAFPAVVHEVLDNMAATARPLRVLFASSEIVPLAKTGGLADVSAALQRALAELGVDVRIVVPGYPEALERAHDKQEPIALGDIQGLGRADVLPDIVPTLRDEGAQFAICGTGGAAIEARVRALAANHPQRVAVRVGYEEPLARRVLAGSDILAAPARFEPCGLTQMYAMRFGTIPVVRAVGGLADTVIGNPGHANGPRATGFHFQQATGRALAGALGQAWGAYRQRDDWRAMQMRAMSQDFRWRRPAERYVALYAALARDGAATDVGRRRGEPC